jgi:hypothetical protein
MPQHHAHLDHARALRTAILAAPQIWLPRRDILLEWLSAFLERAASARYELADTEADDLRALEAFLRQQHIRVA